MPRGVFKNLQTEVSFYRITETQKTAKTKKINWWYNKMTTSQVGSVMLDLPYCI